MPYARTSSTDERVRREALSLGLIRDSNGPRAFEILVRYRASLLTELFRALGALKALQAQDQGAGLLEAGSAARPSSLPETKQTREDAPKQELGLPAPPRLVASSV